MKYKDIKDFNTRCEEHPDHQTGMVTNAMIQQRLHEEIDELRNYIEQAKKQQALDKKADNARELGLDYEPVAWMEDSIEFYAKDHPTNSCTIPLYTAPPRKEWVGLTDDEIWLKTRDINRDEKGWGIKFARAIEAKLKEKNT